MRVAAYCRRAVGCVVVAAIGLVAHAPAAGAYDWTAVDARLEESVRRANLAATPLGLTFPQQPPALAGRYTTESGGGVSFRVADAGVGVYAKSFGTFTGNEVVGMASASKLPSVSAIMTLVDDGLISLATTVAEYFPEYVGTVKGTITLAQMLSHSTGLPAQHVCMNNQAATTLDQCARDVLAGRQAYPPGTAFDYGGASFMIAGRIAELVTGQSWAALFEERISGPLGLTSWTFGDTANPRVPGGLVSSVADYDRFLAMVEAGGVHAGTQIVSAASIAAIRQDRIAGLVRGTTRASSFEGYGLGVWIEEVGADGAATEISDPGAYGTWPWIDFARGYRGLLFMDNPALIGQDNKYVMQGDLEQLVEAQL